MARNRKRAKERRTRSGGRAAVRPRIATAPEEPTPSPLEHATPDVELADAQLAMGRPDPITGIPAAGLQIDPTVAAPELELEPEEEEDGQPEAASARAVAVPAEPRAPIATRLVGFLQGSWRELQRVQWPDRRQVAQATAVVIGFVIVAGVFLGVADLVASKLINFILK